MNRNQRPGQHQQQQQAPTEMDNQSGCEKLDKIKQLWYQACPSSLYDLCLKTLVKNINIILVPNVASETTIVRHEKQTIMPYVPPVVKQHQQQQHAKRKKKLTKLSSPPPPVKPASSTSAPLFHSHLRKYASKRATVTTRYRLADHVGAMPEPICHSIIKEYGKYYLSELDALERDAYFNNSTDKIEPDSSKIAARARQLITYYDLLMAMVNEPRKCHLTMFDYRQCAFMPSALEQRLRARMDRNLSPTPPSPACLAYFRHLKAPQQQSSSSSSASILVSTRGLQRAHLTDKDLKLICKQHRNKLCYLDVCPRSLTNKSLFYLNKYASQSLKYLKLENCCDWENSTNNPQQPEHHHHHHHHHHHQFHGIDGIDRDNIVFWLDDNDNQNNEIMNEEDDDIMTSSEEPPRESEEGGINQKSITDQSNIANEFDQDDDDEDDDDDDDEDENWNEFMYLNEIDSLLNGNSQSAANNDQDDEEDDDEEGLNFDVYLQEYINRFEQQNRHHHHRHHHRRYRNNDQEFGEKKRKSRRSKRHKHRDHGHNSQKPCRIFEVSSRSRFLTNQISKSHRSNLKNIELIERKGIEPATSSQAANEEVMATALANLNDNEATAAALLATTRGDSDSIRSLIEQMELRSEQLQQQQKVDSSKSEERNEQAKTSKNENEEGDEELADYNYGTSSILSSSAAMSILEHNSAATALISTMLNSASSIQILIDIIKRQAATLAEAKVFDRVSLTSSVYNFNDYENGENSNQASTSTAAADNNNNHDDNNVDMQHSSNENEYGDELMDDQEELDRHRIPTYLMESEDNTTNSHSNQARAHFSFSHSSSSLCSDIDDNSDSYSSYSDSYSSSYSSSSFTSSSSLISSSSCSSIDDALLSRRLQRRDFAMLAGKSNKKNRMTSRNRELLLERVANLGSSPIAVLQAIAAKALNLKLKNSKLASTSNNPANNGQAGGSDMNTLSTTSPTETTALAKRRRRRLLRHYKFLKSSNLAIAKQVNPSQHCTSNNATTESGSNLNSQTAGPSGSNTNANNNNNNSSSSLFSVLRFWMNKRSINSNNNGNTTSNGSKANQSSTSSNATGSTMISSTNATSSMLAPTSDMSVQHNISSSHEPHQLPPPLSPNRTLVSSLLLPNLQNLSLRNLGNGVIRPTTLNSLLSSLTQLKYLDLTNCCTGKLHKIASSRRLSDNGIGVNLDELQPWSKPSEFVGCLSSLASLSSTLHTLLMSDLHVEDIQANLKFILKLKNLVKLDVSSCKEKPNMFKNPSLLLAKLAFHLRKLNWLDISGTNICGSSLFKEEEEIAYMKKKLYEDLVDECNDYERVKLDKIETIKSGISGLMFLNNEHRMLDFLGCFSADNSIGSRQNIPARRVASESSERDLFCALEVYAQPADRALFLLDALNHLFELYRDEFVEDRLYGGYLIMNIMEKHLSNARIQISGSASLFYVLKYLKEENIQYPMFYLKRLITTVLNGMEEHIDENAMRRNCVLIMCRLNLPDDVLFVSDRLIRILLKIFEDYIDNRLRNPTNDRPENFVLRTAMHLLNILACSVHGTDKSLVGAVSIPVAMNLIKIKTKLKEVDDMLEVTWSFLWNITDETPENCKIFLDDCDGMSCFTDCIEFKKLELTRNMMGLLGNVAEVKNLRNRLCKNELIKIFRQLLFQNSDGIEIPYNSAGVLVHIMSDGEAEWAKHEHLNEHERQSVIEDIEMAIDKWDLKSERNINYRSFEPIFRLASQFENPICQRWSCWALANLTTVYPDTYCSLFERENGRELLEKIYNYPGVNDAVRKYAGIVFQNVNNRKFQLHQQQQSSSSSSSQA